MTPRNMVPKATSSTASVSSQADSEETDKESLKTTKTSNATFPKSVTFGDRSTVVVDPKGDSPVWVKCESSDAFANPTARSPDETPEQVNQQLHLNLGQNILSPDSKPLIYTIKFLNSILVGWWEHYAFQFWNRIPLAWRRSLCMFMWKLYFPVHKRLLGKSTGIHRDASYEYHALSTIMWAGRLFPVSVERMRFSLSQLSVWCDEPISASHLVPINEPLTDVDPLLVPDCQKDHCNVKGVFMHRTSSTTPTEWTILWVYGGAFLSGDVNGNLGKADWVSKRTNMDVFLCEYRLVPEYNADDVYWDICVAYKWLSQRRDPKKIMLLGISSGGAVCTRLMQFIAESQRGEDLLPSYVAPLVKDMQMPGGAILMGPFVDFTEPKGSLVHYPKHDLVVNQRVLETGVPYLETHLADRKQYSPVHRSCKGLPPLCVVVSEHEAVYTMSVDLINRARQDGVTVTVGCWKYMCHVFSFLDSFIPEGRQSLTFICEWARYMREKEAKE